MGTFLRPMRCPKCGAAMLEWVNNSGTYASDAGTCILCGYNYGELSEEEEAVPSHIIEPGHQREDYEDLDIVMARAHEFYSAPRPASDQQSKAWSDEFRRMRERVSVCRALLREVEKQYASYDEEIRDRNEFRDSIRRDGAGRTDHNEELMPFLAWLDFMDLAGLARTLVNIAVYHPSSSDPLVSYIASRTKADHEKDVSEWREKRKAEKKALWDKTSASEAGGSPSLIEELKELEEKQ